MKKENSGKRNIILGLTIAIFLILIFVAAYATFQYDEININTTIGTRPIFTATPSDSITLNVPFINKTLEKEFEVTNSNSSLNIALSTGYDTRTYCTYDIVWVWDETSTVANQYYKTEGATKEYTVSGSIGNHNFSEVQLNDYDVNNRKTVLDTYEISVSGSSNIANQTVNVTAHFYKTAAIQTAHQNANYSGKVVIENVVCNSTSMFAAGTIASLKGTSGTDGSGNAWGIVEDHGIRYVGQNPSNWVWFNCSSLTEQNASTCERWRIIGVFNEKYDTNNDGVPDTEGNLIKIIRNDSLGSYIWDYKQSGVGSSTNNNGSNDWSDSGLMMMLNPTTFVNSGYVNESDTTAVHSNTINNGYVVSGGINIYQNMGSYFDSSLTAYSPASTSTSGWSSTTEAPSTFVRMNPLSQSMIATTKWYLTGPNGTEYQNTGYGAESLYNSERNIDNAGYVYTGAGTRPKIWYGKIGLMYPSDYGYATSGDSSVSGYDRTRTSCLNKELYNWNSGSYKTYCAYNDWLLYVGATGNTSATKGTATTQWTITPDSSVARYVFCVSGGGGRVASSAAYFAYGVRPVLSLEASVSISGGEGTYDSPYILAQ